MKIANKLKLVFVILLSVFIFGCSSPLVVDTQEQARTQLNMPDPESLNLKDFKWIAVPKDNVDEVFNELETQGDKLVIFGLTEKGYENLSVNMAELKRYIIEQKEIIRAYRNYYESDKNSDAPKMNEK